MPIISKKPVVGTLDSLTRKSDEILNVFTKTQIELEAVNSEIMSLSIAKKEEAKKILDEAAQLDGIATKNARLREKINSFINS